MTLAETADLLSIAAGIDQRTIGESDVRAWQMVLDDIAFTAAHQALRDHYRSTTRRLTPADIVQRTNPRGGYEANAEKGIF
ncbi:hypothetical protein [Streptomyces sp. NBC_00338]|uniref:hypothetical protein n=1 Tax=Streptomyces sp. NBC_00338 TaxID=2975715 RepID=UPI0022551683|nr:hypothetical protein [Streptomyces sp. NBC_00338]MCX5138354.1 hypothetical protein [Streptomyces sp. NBC_00338]MCX5145143.1 hypothetical protein [Streptomyces sp. NBC_00338]